MQETDYIIVAAVVAGAIIVFWIIWAFNRLVRFRNGCEESWSNIDVVLKQRYDMIPSLVQTVQGYAGHEKDTLERVIQARDTAMANHGSPGAQARDENQLVGSLRQLFALAENYPDLKANTSFLRLQSQLTEIEDRIQESRRAYNADVREMNNFVDAFPSNLAAIVFGFGRGEFFQIDDVAARERPELTPAGGNGEAQAPLIDWRRLAKMLALNAGEIGDREARILRQEIANDRRVTNEELGFLAELRREAKKVSPTFDALFFPLVKKKMLTDGRISDGEARWLYQTLFADKVADRAEQKLLQELRAEAKSAGEEFEDMCRKILGSPPK